MNLPQRAYLLHSRPYRDNKLLLELLTEDDGKVAAVVYSGQSVKSNKKGLLQPFSLLSVAFKGRQALKTLTLLESVNRPLSLTGDYLYSGFYLNELMVRLLTEQAPCPMLFLQYQQCLAALLQREDLEINLRLFELALLDELGLALDFSVLSDTSAPYHIFSAELGFVASDDATGAAYPTAHLQAIAGQEFDSAAVLKTFKYLTRQVFSLLLGDKPLHSRQLFRKRELKS